MSDSKLQWPLFPEYSPLVSAELNLEEYPLFELKVRKRGSRARIFERTLSGEDGVSLTQTWKVMPSGEYGMPGPVDQDVYLAVLQLLEERGGMPEDGELRFSLYELKRVLGWSDDSADAYKAIRECLLRLATTSVQSKQAFYVGDERRRLNDTFNIWSVHLADHEVGGVVVRERHMLRFHKIFIRNYLAQYLKGLAGDFYWSLRNPVSKRLYRLIDLQRAGGLLWETDLFDVRDQAPLDYAYPSEIKRALKKAHSELEEKKFLAGVEYQGKTGVVYRISTEFARRQKARELSGDPKEMFAIERLIREGVSGDAARDLVVAHGSEKCLYHADVMSTRSDIRSRGRYLTAAIEKSSWTGAAQEALQEPLVLDPGPEMSRQLGHSARVESPGIWDAVSEDAPRKESGEGAVEVVSNHREPDPAAERAWERLSSDLAALRGSAEFPPWFGDFQGGEIDGTTLTILVPNSMAANDLNDRFGDDLLRLWCQRAGSDGGLCVTTDLSSEQRPPLFGATRDTGA